MRLSDLKASTRREKILEAVDAALKQADVPITTAELCKRIKVVLRAKEDSGYIAKELQKAAASGHPLRRATGETFVKYGREMPRYEWLPSHKASAPDPTPDPALAERRARIAALEAEANTSETSEVNEWEWTPPVEDDGEFLED